MRQVLRFALLIGVVVPNSLPLAAQQLSAAYPPSYFQGPLTAELGWDTMQAMARDAQPARDLPASAAASCSGGDAGGYPCLNVDLLSFMPLSSIGGGNGNDVWGWEDPLTGKEYALMGRTNGSAFVDISDPVNPIYLGNLPTHTSDSTWRDIKVYRDHAFIVSEAGGHGMQVFDLTQLRTVVSPPRVFVETAYYGDFGNAHNVAINEETGFAYAIGTGTCSGGLHMVNIQNPLAPTFAGCFSADGYTHDTHCVIYHGPDLAWVGREICAAFNEDTVTLVDVTDKGAPVQISRNGYADANYTHQGWFTEDQRYVLWDDELDENRLGVNTRTHIFDVSNLDSPVYRGFYAHPVRAIDHNLYVKGSFVYLSNYRSGLRILDITCIDDGILSQVGYFDIYPSDDDASFNGTWSNYPYYKSGVVAVSGIEQGLFIVRPKLPTRLALPDIQETICQGDTITLDAGSGFLSYAWSTGQTTRTIDVTPVTTTSYTVQLDDGGDCLRTGKATVTVRPNPPPSITPTAPVICQREAIILDAGPGYTRYLWSTSETTQTIVVLPLADTTYSVETTSPNGCTAVGTRDVTVVTILAGAGDDREICKGQSVLLGTTQIPRHSYSWSPTAALDDSSLALPLASPTTTTVYTLTVTNLTSGCDGLDQARVTVNPGTPEAMGNVLLAARSGARDIVHVWTVLPAAVSYRLTRRGAKELPPTARVYDASSGTVAWLEVDALLDPRNHFDQLDATRCP